MKMPWKLTREMFLSEAEVNTLLEFLQNRVASSTSADKISTATDELIIQCLVYSGLRNSEFCRLMVADTAIGMGESVFNVTGTPRQDRTVHVPAFVSDSVRQFVKKTRPQVISKEVDPGDRAQPLIFNERGRPYERTGLYRRVVRILNEAGFGERASVQFLRHTYGYLAYKRSGGNLLFVQRQLGHAHPMVTSVYAEFVDEDYRKLADQIGAKADAGHKR